MKNRFKIVFLVLLLFLVTACGSSSDNKNSGSNKKKKNLEGYEVAAIELIDKNGEFNGKYTFKYNSHGDTTRQTKYDKDLNIRDDYTTSYTYLEDGRISNELVVGDNLYNNNVYYWEHDGKIAYITTHFKDFIGDTDVEVYDDERRVIQRTSGSYNYYYTYSKEERIVKTYTTIDDSSTYEVTKYDKNENIIRKENYIVEGFNDYTKKDLTEYTDYDYKNNDGLDYIAKTYDKDNNLISYVVVEYEDNERDYTFKRYDKEDNLIAGSKYIYKPLEEILEER